MKWFPQRPQHFMLFTNCILSSPSLPSSSALSDHLRILHTQQQKACIYHMTDLTLFLQVQPACPLPGHLVVLYCHDFGSAFESFRATC